MYNAVPMSEAGKGAFEGALDCAARLVNHLTSVEALLRFSSWSVCPAENRD